MNQDEEHLRLLSIFHYVVGVLAVLFACMPIFHMIIGIMFIVAPNSMRPAPEMPAALFGWVFLVVGGMMMLMGFAYAACLIYAGRCLGNRRRYTFCLVMGAVCCLFFPFGTVLGVFTLIVLTRPSVKEQFEAQPRSPGSGPLAD